MANTRTVPKWGDDELRQLEKGSFTFESTKLCGREETTDAIRGVVGDMMLGGEVNHG